MRVGQAVVEVLIAMGIVTVALLALIQVATRSVSNSGQSKRQSVATAYAQEGLEWIKRQRSVVAWSNFYDNGNLSPYCLNTIPAAWDAWSTGACGSATIAGTEYTREARLTASVVGGNQQLAAVVEVRWSEGGRTSSSRQETYFLRY